MNLNSLGKIFNLQTPCGIIKIRIAIYISLETMVDFLDSLHVEDDVIVVNAICERSDNIMALICSRCMKIACHGLIMVEDVTTLEKIPCNKS